VASNQIIARLVELRIAAISGVLCEASVEKINGLENILQTELPIAYKKYLKKFGGSNNVFETNVFFRPKVANSWTRSDGLDVFEIFYGLTNANDSIDEAISIYRDRIPKSVIPIAGLPGGNQLCIGLSSDFTNRIYFWDADCEDSDMQSADKLFLVADDFDDLINRFIVIDEEKFSTETNDDILVEEKWNI